MNRDLLEREVAIKEELLRRGKDDPLLGYCPSPKQNEFIRAVLYGDNTENWLCAANRTGKSDCGAYIGSYLARFGDPNPKWVGGLTTGTSVSVKDRATSGWVVSLDFPSARDIIQPKYFDNGFGSAGSHAPFIPDREIQEWRVSDQILRLKNGSIIGFKSGDSGRKKFQGADKDWIHFDEEPEEGIYDESGIRIGAGRILRVFGTCTILPPENQVGGVSWLYSRRIKPFVDGKAENYAVFGASIYDNPYLDPGEVKRLEAKYPLHSVIGRIRLLGEWLPGLSGARAYPSFDRLLHVRDQSDKFNPRRPLAWMLDFNVEPMVSLVGQRDGRIFRVFQEIVMEEGNIFEMVDLFKEKYPNHPAEIWIYGDASGRTRTAQTGDSDYQLILSGLRSYPSPVRLKIPEKNPRVVDRINSLSRLLKDENGEIRIEVDPSCEELIMDLEQVLRDKNGGIKKTSNRKDSYFKRTHTSDALGYWLLYEEPVAAGYIEAVPFKSPDIGAPGYGFN